MKVTGRFHYGWLVLAGAFLAYASFGISRHLFPYILPSMEAELKATHKAMGNIASVYFISYTMTTFLWGIVADRIGPRKCMLIGQVTILVGLTGMGFMSSLPAGFIFYALCGAGAAGQSIPAVRLISDWFSGTRRGSAFGIAIAGTGIMTTVLGLGVPMILASYSWRWSWWFGAAFVLLTAVVSWFLLVDRPAKRGLDRIGDSHRELSPSTPEHIKESHKPLAPRVAIKDILKRGTVWNLIGLSTMRRIGYVIFMTFAVAYLQEIGWDIRAAAGVLATWAALQIPGPIIWGIAADRITKKYLLAAALALEAIGILIFIGSSLTMGSYLGTYLGAAIIGFADIGLPTIISASMADYYEPTTTATAFGLITQVTGIGVIAGPTIGGAIADATGTLLTAMLTGLGALVIAFFLALMLKKPPPRPGS